MKKVFVALLTGLLLSACATTQSETRSVETADSTIYKYPINNPYAATIVGTPSELRKGYPDVPRTSEQHLTVFKDRKVPEGFWYEKDFVYGELLQDHPAPLIYIIPGTGADYRSRYTRHLGEVFYHAGFHVILLTSTTHQNFIVTASENFIPGRPMQSAKDLYRVMKMIDTRVTKEASVTNRYMAGYSLGGMDVAFISYLDDQEKALNFRKAVMINPPYSIYNSIQKIDKMLYEGLPGGMNGIDRFIDTEMARLAAASPTGDPFDFQNAQLLMKTFSEYKPSDARLATTIGLAFRLFAANMMFTSDVMAHTGYIFPKNVELTTGTPLTDYMTVALRTSLLSYFSDVYSPYYMHADSGMTQEALVRDASLEVLAPYLQNNPKIGVITNADDVVLSPGEVERMKALFGSNAFVFPNGGHLGNLMYPPVSNTILQFIVSGEQK